MDVAKAKAKEDAYRELYKKLDTKDGEKDLHCLAKQRDRAGKDVQHVRAINDANWKVAKVKEFKYLGSTVQSNGECRSEVTERVQAGWNSWKSDKSAMQ